jgi:signal transduction histidine kinase
VPLRWKLLVSHLVVLWVGLLVASLAFRGVAVRAVSSRMGGMMGSMMPGVVRDLQGAVSAGVQQAILVSVGVAGVVAVAVSLAVALWITRPLRHLADAARRIADGQYGRRVAYQAADEIGEFTGAFNDMAERLEATERLRSELLATIAHELKTPLTNIEGYMEALLDGVVAPEPETYEMVRKEAGRLSRLVGDIQRLSRLEAGAERLDPQTVDAAAAVRAAAEGVRPQFEQQHLALTVDIPESHIPERPALAWVDPDKLQQVLLNLLSNAQRYTPEGGSVSVRLEESPSELRFVVSDTGIGIPPSDLAHIFERFYRVDKSRSSAGGGAGIGLAVVKSLIEQSGGAVGAESTVGKGTTVWFTLPVGPRPPVSPPPPADRASPSLSA